jgi:hypothetical protein
VARLRLGRWVPQRGFWLPATALMRAERGLWATMVLRPIPGEASEEDDPSEADDDAPTVDQARSDRVQRFRTARAQVELLDTRGQWVYARGPLSEGDRLVARGVNAVALGQVVRIAQTLEGPAAEPPPKPTNRAPDPVERPR